LRLCLGIALIAAAKFAGAADIVQTYFAAFPENEARMTFMAIDNYAGYVGTKIRTIISIVPSIDGTVIYYDNWEDGYEADPTAPTQASTEVWGDNNPANGIPPGFTSDVVNAGNVINLEATIDVTREAIRVEYDGSDKIVVTKPVALSRAIYAIQPGEVMADDAQLLDTSQWGLTYRAPVGYDVGTGANTNQMFEYSALYVMAGSDFTRVEIDKDNDGVFDVTIRLDQGQTYMVNGGVKAGATVRATKPVQCHMATGDIGSNYELRFFEMWPTSSWGDEYFTPVGARTNAAGVTYGTFVLCYNPATNPITINYRTRTGSGSVTAPAGGVSAPVHIPRGSGGHVYTTNGSVFAAVQVFDSYDTMQAYDWGAGLPPGKLLSSMAICGWGPGYGTTGGGGAVQQRSAGVGNRGNQHDRVR
jgi:hypothetical protein